MKTKIALMMLAVLVLGMAEFAKADGVDISVATDKSIYQLDEDVLISITAYNPSSQQVLLGFATTLQVSYLLDNVFDLSDHIISLQIPTVQIIDPYSSYTWDRTHGFNASKIYPLDVGSHTLIGEVVGYGNSQLIEFEVIPEPAAFILLAIGIGFLPINKRKKSQ